MHPDTIALHARGIPGARASGPLGTGDRYDDAPAGSPETARGARRFRSPRERVVPRGSPASQSRAVLLGALAECAPAASHHSTEVGRLAELTASRLGLEEVDRAEIRLAGDLHDVGKVAISNEILDKPGALTREERFVVELHSVIGERILSAAPALADVARLVRSAHEWVDGTGYPDRLAGEAIPLGSRLIAVCDAYDAMVSDRPHQQAVGTEAALAELRRSAGSQFDPEMVEVVSQSILETIEQTSEGGG